MRSFFVVLVLGIAWAASAGGALDAETTAGRPWVVKGTVVDTSGKPIAGARVGIVWFRTEALARADLQGRFTLSLPVPWDS